MGAGHVPEESIAPLVINQDGLAVGANPPKRVGATMTQDGRLVPECVNVVSSPLEIGGKACKEVLDAGIGHDCRQAPGQPRHVGN